MFKGLFLVLMLGGTVFADLTRQEDFEMKIDGSKYSAVFFYDANYKGKHIVLRVTVDNVVFPERADIPTDAELAEKADSYALLAYQDFKDSINATPPIKSKRKVLFKLVKND